MPTLIRELNFFVGIACGGRRGGFHYRTMFVFWTGLQDIDTVGVQILDMKVTSRKLSLQTED